MVNGIEEESEGESESEGEGGGEGEGGSGSGGKASGGASEAGAASPQQPPSPKRRVIGAGLQMPDLSVCERDLVVVDIHLHHIFSLVSLEQKISRSVLKRGGGAW